MVGDQAGDAALLQGRHPRRDDLGMAEIPAYEQQVMARQRLGEGSECRTIGGGHRPDFDLHIPERYGARILARNGSSHMDRFPNH
ncbi:hypothetical protein D9M71_796310 [compost metagenome]